MSLWVFISLLFLLHPLDTEARFLPFHLASSPSTQTPSIFPVVFLHGIIADTSDGDQFKAKFMAEGRPFKSLDFCNNKCSIKPLKDQIVMAIDALRELQTTDPRFSDGYILMGHSQGGLLSRAIVEEMDDHKVRKLISLSGVQNGLFFGPQQSDLEVLETWMQVDRKWLEGSDIDFPFENYTLADVHGKLQQDYHEWAKRYVDVYSPADYERFPVDEEWIATSDYLPRLNNMNDCFDSNDYARCRYDAMRRRRNFLKVDVAHFLASPADAVLTPWQSAIFGKYAGVSSVHALEEEFDTLQVLPMESTAEYTMDTFGLQEMHDRKALHLHVAGNVNHVCWVRDFMNCSFNETYAKYVHPLL